MLIGLDTNCELIGNGLRLPLVWYTQYSIVIPPYRGIEEKIAHFLHFELGHLV